MQPKQNKKSYEQWNYLDTWKINWPVFVQTKMRFDEMSLTCAQTTHVCMHQKIVFHYGIELIEKQPNPKTFSSNYRGITGVCYCHPFNNNSNKHLINTNLWIFNFNIGISKIKVDKSKIKVDNLNKSCNMRAWWMVCNLYMLYHDAYV